MIPLAPWRPGAPWNLPRYSKYGLYHAYTGELMAEFDTRSQANAAKTSLGFHVLRVRGIPNA